ncbi:hypothetical protein C5167_023192 [Papaver somniferum]|uniref:Uncharacterized protein n=1 Tax=Papaver somniferum TaxID=3469 RepID=A0A4Y7JNQ5_PAPSO|nr:transcription factor MYB57-like [Papaver somniferum]RZC61428.1 hypothetical protein C5167_023192 [Papaver somniferum]
MAANFSTSAVSSNVNFHEDEEEEENENGVLIHEDELRRGPWTLDEDKLLVHYISFHGDRRWNHLAKSSGLKRTGKSCRLRWLNYLKPDVKRGNLTIEEQILIIQLQSKLGNRWSRIAKHLPGRTDNEIKNYWRTRVQKQERQRLKFDPNNMPALFPEDHSMGCFAPRTTIGIMGDQNCRTAHGGQALISDTANCSSSTSSLVPNSTISISTAFVDTSKHHNSQTASNSTYTTSTSISAAGYDINDYSFPKALDSNYQMINDCGNIYDYMDALINLGNSISDRCHITEDNTVLDDQMAVHGLWKW